MKEYIICSAVWVHTGATLHGHQPQGITEGFVVCGRRHGDCYKVIDNMNKQFLYKTEAKDMGFLTNLNRFVNRREGMKIAKAADQLLFPQYHKDKKEDDELFILTSEDLFPITENE